MATIEKKAEFALRAGNNAVVQAIATLAAEQHRSVECRSRGRANNSVGAGESGTPRHMGQQSE
jgi:hypothetical protein